MKRTRKKILRQLITMGRTTQMCRIWTRKKRTQITTHMVMKMINNEFNNPVNRSWLRITLKNK